MLSQKPEDLPDEANEWTNKARWSDTATWVRVTHVLRMRKLVTRLLLEAGHSSFVNSPHFSSAINIASAHQAWPWQWQGDWQTDRIHRGLAATLAVADLLDEDAGRCDTDTLVHHREGTPLNYAHWLRHSLTDGRIVVQLNTISIRMVRLPGTGEALEPVYSALRNHFRLIKLYRDDLRHLDAEITHLGFEPETGTPIFVDEKLTSWSHIPVFPNQNALCYHLLTSFMPEAIKDPRFCTPDALARLQAEGLEDVDHRLLSVCQGLNEPRTTEERAAHAILAQRP